MLVTLVVDIFVITCRHCKTQAMLSRVSRVFKGFLEELTGYSDHVDTVLTRYPGGRVPGPKNTLGFGSDPHAVMVNTRPGKPAG